MASWCTYRDPSWKSIANTGENVVAAIKVIISWIDKQENMNCKCSKIVFTLSTEIVYKIYISDQKISGVCWCWCEFMIEIQHWGTGHSYIICTSIELFMWLFSYCCTSFHNDSLTSDGNFLPIPVNMNVMSIFLILHVGVVVQLIMTKKLLTYLSLKEFNPPVTQFWSVSKN